MTWVIVHGAYSSPFGHLAIGPNALGHALSVNLKVHLLSSHYRLAQAWLAQQHSSWAFVVVLD